MHTAPVLSVVVLNYNYGRYLPRCMDGILGQTFRDFEVIFIDDCSREDPSSIMAPFASDPRVRIVRHQKNKGFQASLIEGTEELARGEFCVLVSADDVVLHDDAFAIQIGLLREHAAAAFCFSAVRRMDADGDWRGDHTSFPAQKYAESAEALKLLLTDPRIWPVHSGTVIRSSAYRKAGGYRRDVTMPLDLAMWVALAMRGGFVYSPEALYGYRVHAAQMSAAPDGIEINTREVVTILREGCEEGENLGLSTRRLRREAVRNHLGGTIVYEAFSSQEQNAKIRWLKAVKVAPLESLTSRKHWAGLIRAWGGKAVFELLVGAYRTLHPALSQRRSHGVADRRSESLRERRQG